MTISVKGVKYTDDELMVRLPKVFEGIDFDDMHELSMACMFWGCYKEAYFNHNSMLLADHADSILTLLMNKGVDVDALGLTYMNLIER